MTAAPTSCYHGLPRGQQQRMDLYFQPPVTPSLCLWIDHFSNSTKLPPLFSVVFRLRLSLLLFLVGCYPFLPRFPSPRYDRRAHPPSGAAAGCNDAVGMFPPKQRLVVHLDGRCLDIIAMTDLGSGPNHSWTIAMTWTAMLRSCSMTSEIGARGRCYTKCAIFSGRRSVAGCGDVYPRTGDPLLYNRKRGSNMCPFIVSVEIARHNIHPPICAYLFMHACMLRASTQAWSTSFLHTSPHSNGVLVS